MSEIHAPQDNTPIPLERSRQPLILIQNHDGALLELFQEMFNQWGYTSLLLTHQHAEAESLANEQNCDLIILDFTSLTGNGIETTVTIKAMYETRGGVSLIGVAGYNWRAEEQFMEAGADAYVPMPFSLTTFHDTVQRLLSTTPLGSRST